ncbi:hypothetical protein C0J52_26381 [Blattella germanica]|nr:hypothetical protein C0J52_26381 [Blattella germanica]
MTHSHRHCGQVESTFDSLCMNLHSLDESVLYPSEPRGEVVLLISVVYLMGPNQYAPINPSVFLDFGNLFPSYVMHIVCIKANPRT